MYARLRGPATLVVALLLSAAVPTLRAQQPPPAAAAKPVTLTAQQLDLLVGQYRPEGEKSVIYSFSSDGKTLSLSGPRIMPTPLTAVSPLRFAAPDGGPEFTFALAPQGHAESVLRQGSDTPARLIDPHPAHYTFRPYTRQEAMIPMRDGVKLHVVILRPADHPANGNAQEPLPILMERTPYGVDDVTPAAITYRFTELAQSGYIFVYEDIRGRYKSEGTFVMMRPLLDVHSPALSNGQPSASPPTDESTDSYDTVAWLLKNVPGNNGRVGVAGISYPGGMAQDAGIGPHPAVRAISPQAPMIDVWKGDDFFHNGAFRETYGYDYVLGMESGKTTTFQKLDQDAYNYFLNAGSYAAAAKQGKIDQLPTAQAFFAHPAYDSYWQARGVETHLTSLSVPSLEVGGYWDQEDMWGPQAAYAALRQRDPSSKDLFLVLGPWRHGGWAGSTERLGAVDFGEPTSDEYRTRIEAPFFEHYLKDQGTFNTGGAMTFQTGSDSWKQYASWPPPGSHSSNLYLGADGSLSFQQQDAPDATSFASYVSDPANPVPYRARPIQATYAPGSKWGPWMVEDQRPFTSRKDVATFTTPALDHDLTITGDVVADLFASTSGTDSDWVVKLIDVYPPDAPAKMAGFQLMVNGEIFRGRYRTSFSQPEAVPAGQPQEYRFSLHGADHVFERGHRIMVEVQSTWFPLYDRNPQTFVPNIMTAAPADFHPATQRIYFSSRHPSHIELPLVEGPVQAQR
jgi:uncharacterized protein